MALYGDRRRDAFACAGLHAARAAAAAPVRAGERCCRAARSCSHACRSARSAEARGLARLPARRARPARSRRRLRGGRSGLQRRSPGPRCARGSRAPRAGAAPPSRAPDRSGEVRCMSELPPSPPAEGQSLVDRSPAPGAERQRAGRAAGGSHGAKKPHRLRIGVQQRCERRAHDRRGHRIARQRRRRAWRWPRSAWAGSAACGCTRPRATSGRPGCRSAARSRCWPAWRASTPAGALRRARRKPAARSSSRSAPARRARSPARKTCSPSWATATAPPAAASCSRSIAPPPAVVVEKVLRDCGLAPEGLTIILTPTTSLAGITQVVARVLEVALHKAHEIGFALRRHRRGQRPPRRCRRLPATCVEAMGRSNDAILYGGRVHLGVRGSDEAARALAERLPSLQLERLRARLRGDLPAVRVTTSTRSIPPCSRRPRCG